ncbi:Transmembrane protein 256 [Hondaea fermentalgiana]|uniref:Transmembrane protein 256 n=1 Tax=Hondaea fermentalgiana TaxID=2315210 RepID=A0A2R5GI19_9STRA|nr:Transmembrane protein 256 [Hondaea fermentalgiana]|eukprot:GBG30537.1 Transmembrane protein 256 [Hondaea fermentalgiana]
MRPIVLAGISGALAIVTGAFGAHALRGKVDDRMAKVWETASHYHLVNSVAMLVAAKMVKEVPGGAAAQPRNLPVTLFAAGITLFSGSLYAMVLTGETKLGMITPIGGFTLIAAWLSLIF